jgi:hypothetical protein
MIVDDATFFTEKMKENCKDQDINILTAATNRDAFEQISDEKQIDLFLIPTYSSEDEKGYLACKSSDSFQCLTESFDHLLLEKSSSDELKTFLKDNLYSSNK